MALTAGEIIDGKYRIVRMIGEGGMGSVYEGENTRIHRRVAIKVLHQGVAENHEAVQRFEREAQAAGRIGNDHIMEVIDLGTLPTGEHFMVMEYLEGEPLSTRIRSRGKLRAEDAAGLMIQALEGLRAAHEVGIVHRDLKPENVYIVREKSGHADFVKLIDFGISKFQSLGGGEMKMTRTGTVMGTPYYMSPEQASGSREADQRSDLYAVGVMLYEAVTGKLPFDAATFNQLLFQIVLSDPIPPQQLVPELDPGFSNLIAKAMARDIEVRFQSAQELAHALSEWMRTGATVSVPPTGPINPHLPRAAMSSKAQIELDRTVSARAVTGGAPTPDSWSASRLEPIAGLSRSKSRVAIGMAMVGLVAVIGAVLGWSRLQHGNHPIAEPSALSSPGLSNTTAAIAATVAVPTIDVVPVSAASSLPVPVPASSMGQPKGVASATAKNPPIVRGGIPSRRPNPTVSRPSAPRGHSGQVDFGY